MSLRPKPSVCKGLTFCSSADISSVDDTAVKYAATSIVSIRHLSYSIFLKQYTLVLLKNPTEVQFVLTKYWNKLIILIVQNIISYEGKAELNIKTSIIFLIVRNQLLKPSISIHTYKNSKLKAPSRQTSYRREA
jgi:hypothetical protein